MKESRLCETTTSRVGLPIHLQTGVNIYAASTAGAEGLAKSVAIILKFDSVNFRCLPRRLQMRTVSQRPLASDDGQRRCDGLQTGSLLTASA